MNEFRPLSVRVGSKTIANNQRVRVRGSHNMTLIPDFFMLDIYNLSDEDRAILGDEDKITVIGKDGFVLCRGEVEDMYNHLDGVNVITTVSVLDGKRFSETRIYETVGAGATIESTFRTIMRNAAVGSFRADDFRCLRAQTFSGMLPDVISMLAKSVHARGFITMDTVHIVAKGMASDIISIADIDVIDDEDSANGIKIIKTDVKGFPVGALINYGDKKYRLVSQKIDADNYKGNWDSILILVDEKEISVMEGG